MTARRRRSPAPSAAALAERVREALGKGETLRCDLGGGARLHEGDGFQIIGKAGGGDPFGHGR